MHNPVRPYTLHDVYKLMSTCGYVFKIIAFVRQEKLNALVQMATMQDSILVGLLWLLGLSGLSGLFGRVSRAICYLIEPTDARLSYSGRVTRVTRAIRQGYESVIMLYYSNKPL